MKYGNPRYISSPRATYVTISSSSPMEIFPSSSVSPRLRSGVRKSVSMPSWMIDSLGRNSGGNCSYCHFVGVTPASAASKAKR